MINDIHTWNPDGFITMGAIHLNNTSLEKSIEFWTKIIGMKLRKRAETTAEFGSENKTLVVVHETADKPFVSGYSWLYHFAIHLKSKEEFSKMLYRVMVHKYPCSPTDHTMLKSVYLNDPDGIGVEFALETPERYKAMVPWTFLVEDTDGSTRRAVASLDVEDALSSLADEDITTIISDEAKIGHVHLYAKDLYSLNEFYKDLWFQQFNNLPQFTFADVGAGGACKHLIAMNMFHGVGKGLAPDNHAGMQHFHIVFDSEEMLSVALKNLPDYRETDEGFWMTDPTGNTLLLSL